MTEIFKSLSGNEKLWCFTSPETGVLFVHRIFPETGIMHPERAEKIIKFEED
jgi:hypothetical protein